MEAHVIQTLNDLGHDVRAYDARQTRVPFLSGSLVVKKLIEKLLREPELRHDKAILKEVFDFEPDFVLVILGSMVSPKTIRKLRDDCGAYVVCWSQDAMVTMGKQFLIGAPYNKIYVKDHYMVERFSKFTGISCEYLPEACNPKLHRSLVPNPVDLNKYTCEITTYGYLYYYRQHILSKLIDYDIKLWGNVSSWFQCDLPPHVVMNEAIFGDDKAKALQCAKIVLNTLHYGEVRSLNVRAFEVAGCGGFQLMSHTDVVSDHFEIGTEIVTFVDIPDLREKVAYYLAHDDERKEIARRGQERAHRDHTYTQRLQVIIDDYLASDRK